MMNKNFRVRSKLSWTVIVAAALMAFLAWTSPRSDAAEAWSLYVRRSEVTNVVQGGHMYAPLGDLLMALGYQWTENAGTVTVTPGTAGGPVVKTRLASVTVVAGARTFNCDCIMVKGSPWVSVKALTEGLGFLYVSTASANIVQVVPGNGLTDKDLARAVKENQTLPVAKPVLNPASLGPGKDVKDANPSPVAVAENASPKPSSSGSADEEKDPIEVVKIDYMNPIIPGANHPAELRGTATIKNTSDKPVTNVRFTVVLDDLGGNVVTSLPPKFLSVMQPGETASQDIMWYNYYNQQITPKVKIEHDAVAGSKKGAASGAPAPTASGAALPPPSGGTTPAERPSATPSETPTPTETETPLGGSTPPSMPESTPSTSP